LLYASDPEIQRDGKLIKQVEFEKFGIEGD
jgi:hypothetical protein